jgi:hypothetical protein
MPSIPNFKVDPSMVHVPNHRLTPANPLAFPSAVIRSVGVLSSVSVRDPIRVQRHSLPIRACVLAVVHPASSATPKVVAAVGNGAPRKH